MSLVSLHDVSLRFRGPPLLDGVTSRIEPGQRIGLLGRNGAGKISHMRLLLGQFAPVQGAVRLGTNLRIAFFDQLRDQLGDEKTVADDGADGYETVQIGDRSWHVIGYIQNSLFTPERTRTPVRFLSGGERNRLLLPPRASPLHPPRAAAGAGSLPGGFRHAA